MIKTPENEPFNQLEIEWIDPENAYETKLPLFGSISSPFSIKQSSIIVSNIFMLFQALAQYPELLKSRISKV